VREEEEEEAEEAVSVKRAGPKKERRQKRAGHILPPLSPLEKPRPTLAIMAGKSRRNANVTPVVR
jgi:hypothetical protein